MRDIEQKIEGSSANASSPALEKELYALAEKLGISLVDRRERLITVESCTGGWIAKAVTDVAGSSAWFECGLVTYSNETKQGLLDVPNTVLREHGAVSGETVAAMTRGALAHLDGDWAVATSGVAGPDGGSEDKPVGTVWFAWMQRERDPSVQCVHFTGDRRAVRLASAVHAIRCLIEQITLTRP